MRSKQGSGPSTRPGPSLRASREKAECTGPKAYVGGHFRMEQQAKVCMGAQVGD